MAELKVRWMGDDACVGNVVIGSVSYNSLRERGNPNEYVAYCTLPHVKPRLGEFVTKEEGIKKLESIWVKWWERLNATID